MLLALVSTGVLPENPIRVVEGTPNGDLMCGRKAEIGLCLARKGRIATKAAGRTQPDVSLRRIYLCRRGPSP